MASSLVDMIVADYVEKANAANSTAENISVNTVDSNKLLHEIRDNRETDDPQIRKFHALLDEIDSRREKAVSQIENYIREKKMPARDGSVDVEALKETHKKQKAAAQNALRFLADQIEGDVDAFLKEKNIPELKNLRGGSSGTAGSSGISRPRIVGGYIDGEEVEKDGKTNFTLLAAALSKKSGEDVNVRDLQEAAFSAAGTNDLKTLKGKTFEFSFGVADKNYMIRITPKDPDAEKNTPAQNNAPAETPAQEENSAPENSEPAA